MAAKDVKFSTDARDKMLHGVDVLAFLLVDEEFRADVGRHDDDDVLEVNDAALAVGDEVGGVDFELASSSRLWKPATSRERCW